ncbi:hypothetical protein FNV58_01190 (plasmid) [Streptomyces sp. RLB1-9]|uniref:beta barrel domain-containing protein n=1 Tax=Streptomyces sp. RLB1-9 TaxID=2594454 RepID=UPI0011622AE0|nr:hypothetical protein [Streptomyces sp. RLB1-9]QDN94976.1 hypothetical protein FNV58_01190 [Streptomyces sp. RLB1-9]
MALPDNLKKGDPLVLVSADSKREPRNVVVSRVGRAWVYVCREGETEETRDQFNRVTGVSKENHGWARWLVTPEQYAEMKEREQLLADLKAAGVEIEHKQQDTMPLAKLRGLLAAVTESDLVTVRLPRDLASEVACIIGAHLDEYFTPNPWGVIEAVRQMDPERGASMYRSRRYNVNGGTVYDTVDRVEVETEFADSDASRAWVNTHGKTCASRES